MSRSNYSDDLDNWAIIRWRGAVDRALLGARGQAFLKEMLLAMDAMPSKRLIAEELIRDGEVCGLGVVGQARGIEMGELDPYDAEVLADLFGIAPAMVREIEAENDDVWRHDTPEQRFLRMREWVMLNIGKEQP